jgi:protein SCO1/2
MNTCRRTAAHRWWGAMILGWGTLAPAAVAFDPDQAMQLSQAAIGHATGDYVLVTTRGTPLRMSELRGRPVIVSMIYTSCVHICAPTTAQLRGSVREARKTLGEKSFSVVSVGFDTLHDTPGQLADFARSLRIDDPDWYFATADAATVAALSRDLGFSYAPAVGGFDHLVQTTILDDRGRVYRQIYGDSFAGPVLIDPLKRVRIGASPTLGAAPSLLERVRLLCTVYDPKSGRYRFDYSLILSGVVGALCFAGIALFIGRNWRGAVRARRRAPDS